MARNSPMLSHEGALFIEALPPLCLAAPPVCRRIGHNRWYEQAGFGSSYRDRPAFLRWREWERDTYIARSPARPLNFRIDRAVLPG